MNKSRFLGIYISRESVCLAEVDNKKVKGSTILDFSSIPKKNPVSELDELGGLDALIRKGVKDIGATTTDAYISISDTNVLFRMVEVPLMSAQELAGSLKYEIAHHIPFKIEDVYYEWKQKRVPQAKRLLVSFVSVRKVFVDSIVKTVESLGLTVHGLEPSFVSLQRVLASDRAIQNSLKKVKRYAIFDFSAAEANIIFCEDIPLFSRNIKVNVTDGAAGAAGTSSIDYMKLKEELSMSLNYYNREFRDKALEMVFVVCDDLYKESILALNKDFSVPFEAVSVSRMLAAEGATNVRGIKAYSVALRDTNVSPFNIDFLSKRSTAASMTGMSEPSVFDATGQLQMPMIFLAAGLSAAIIGGTIMFVNQKKSAFSPQLRMQEVSKDSAAALDKKYAALTKSIQEIETQLNSIKKKRKMSTLFGDIPGLMAEGMWLNNLNLSKDKLSHRYTVEIIGQIYFGDEEREMRSLDEFIGRMKKSKSDYVLNEIKIVYKERKKEVTGEEILSFQIRGVGE